MERAGVFFGCPDGSFGGERPADRQEVVYALARLLSTQKFGEPRSDLVVDVLLAQFAPAALPASPRHPLGGPPFADVPRHDYMVDANELGKVGLLRGYPDSTFRPQRVITRAELAVIVARLLRRIERRPPLDLQRAFFRDVRGDEWWFGAMLVSVGAGVMEGYPDHSFRGSRRATRNELAAALARLLELTERPR